MKDFPGIIISESADIADVDISNLQASLKQNGLVLIRNHSVNENSFKAFTNSFCPEFVPHFNTEREFIGDATMMLVSPGTDHFFAHAEMAYSPLRPEVAIFYCVQPAAEGGETTICDGTKVLKLLDQKTRKAFEENLLLFENMASWKELAPNVADVKKLLEPYVSPAFTYRLENDNLFTRYITPAIFKTSWTSEYAFANSVLDSQAPLFSNRTLIPKPLLWDVIGVSESLMYPVAWQSGDILLVDNSRFMHGRRAWTDPKRRIIVRFGNLERRHSAAKVPN